MSTSTTTTGIQQLPTSLLPTAVAQEQQSLLSPAPGVAGATPLSPTSKLLLRLTAAAFGVTAVILAANYFLQKNSCKQDDKGLVCSLSRVANQAANAIQGILDNIWLVILGVIGFLGFKTFANREKEKLNIEGEGGENEDGGNDNNNDNEGNENGENGGGGGGDNE